MEPYLITDISEFEYCISRGFNPLFDIINFKMSIDLRVVVQKEKFGRCIIGRGDIPQSNERFFRYIWENKPHICEETMKPLYSYSAVYCSHILTRGAHPEMAHDPRNINILSFESHNIWENGERQKMRIYKKNMRMIKLLKDEYSQLKIIE